MSLSHLPTDHAHVAEQLLHPVTEGGAMPPSLRVGVAHVHALLAVVDAIERLRSDQAALAALRDLSS